METYKLRTKENILKPITDCTQDEIIEGLIELNQIKADKGKKINKMEMSIMDLESELDDYQAVLSHKRKYLQEEKDKQETREKIIQQLMSCCTNTKITLTQFVCTKLESIQIN